MRKTILWTAVLGTVLSVPALAQNPITTPRTERGNVAAPPVDRGMATDERREERRDARENRRESRADSRELLNDAVKVVQNMKRDADVSRLLQRAEGVYIVPEFGKAALGIGGRGGQGVLLVQRNGQWTGPAFYNMGGISVGLQAGASGGSIAMLLMTDKAVNTFKQDNNFSLNADADLTVISYSAAGQASAGKGDVILWSGTKGLFAGVAVSVTDINFDDDDTAAYYGRKVAASDVINGTVREKQAQANALIQALPPAGAVGATGTGAQGGQTYGPAGATRR